MDRDNTWVVDCTNLALVLEPLCEDPGAVATLPLNLALGVPEGYGVQGRKRVAVTPRLCISVVPRRVKWETDKLGYIIKTPQDDRTVKLEFDPTKRRKYKPGITAGKILVLIRTKESDEEPEIPRSLASSARQAYSDASGVDKTISES